jgi:AraC-like DNA-binding protein
VVKNSNEYLKDIVELLDKSKINPITTLAIKAKCFHLISAFFAEVTVLKIAQGINTVPINEQSQVANAEKIIVESLTNQFLGIELIAKKVHMSPTKLKTLFKVVFGKSMFQYYQHKQMNLAFELLQNRSKSIKEVSEILGYDNPSNFTNAFKKVYNILPSHV